MSFKIQKYIALHNFPQERTPNIGYCGKGFPPIFNEIFPDGKGMLLRSDVRLTASEVAAQ
jgi:hypothetical protein